MSDESRRTALHGIRAPAGVDRTRQQGARRFIQCCDRALLGHWLSQGCVKWSFHNERKVSPMIFVLQLLLYLVAWLFTFGLFTVVAWYVRYAIAVIVALLPCFGVFWLLWTWLVAIPMALLFDGSPAEKRIVIISHWLNDRTGDVLMFFLTLPYHVFIWISDIAGWLVHRS